METWGRPGENYRKEEIRGGGWKKWRRKNRSNGRGGNGAGWIGDGVRRKEEEGARGIEEMKEARYKKRRDTV